MTINYNQIYKTYDDVREGDIETINAFLKEVSINKSSRVLDIGCGTGNYSIILERLTEAKTFGIDPSEGMLDKARKKNSRVVFTQGTGGSIPFENDYFDFIYMTDVIHHIPDLNELFLEMRRVLKTQGKICIMTQSHKQIENRPITRYFPGTANVDKQRYPTLSQINQAALNNGLVSIKEEILYEDQPVVLSTDFLELIEKKGYSMLHLISDEEYGKGLSFLKEDISQGAWHAKTAGTTLLWFIRL
jgi:ubiquinone/menaquinone biosynthesis C-methylase UbiE